MIFDSESFIYRGVEIRFSGIGGHAIFLRWPGRKPPRDYLNPITKGALDNPECSREIAETVLKGILDAALAEIQNSNDSVAEKASGG